MENKQYIVEDGSIPQAVQTDGQTVQLASEVAPIASPLRVSKRWTLILIASLVLFIGSIGTILLRLHSSSQKEQAKNQSIQPQEIDLSNLSEAATRFPTDTKDRVVINGQLQTGQGILLTPSDKPQTSTPGLIYLDKTTNQINYFNGQDYDSFASKAELDALAALLNQFRGTGLVNSLQGQTGVLTLLGSGGLSISTSGRQLSLNLPQDLRVSASPTFNNLALSGTLQTNSISQLNAGTNLTINAGNDQLSFIANGISYNLPGGDPDQTICTNKALCLVGGGTAVLLGQLNAQPDTEVNKTSIFIDKQTSGDLLNLLRSNAPRFRVDNDGNTTIAGILGVNTITPQDELKIGADSQTFTIKGNNLSSIYAQDSGPNRVTVNFQASGSVTGSPTYYFDRSAPTGSYLICTTDPNAVSLGCGGGGGPTNGVGTFGTITGGRLAMFHDGTSIEISSISDNASTVTINSRDLKVDGALIVNNISQSSGTLTVGTTGSQLTLQGDVSTKLTA
ncbi:MAG TPA: hypothetical protein VJC09_00970, partial [Candidatus Saccharimonadales bacterium]|nr:hypothetical protein [Candidatus Saccharimonadales bacterium]